MLLKGQTSIVLFNFVDRYIYIYIYICINVKTHMHQKFYKPNFFPAF